MRRALAICLALLVIAVLWRSSCGTAPSAGPGSPGQRPVRVARPAHARIAEIAAPQVRLAGLVVDARGAPVADAAVILGARPELRTDRAGRFVFEDLPRGPAHLHASAGAEAAGPLELALAGDAFVTLRLHPGVMLEVEAVSAIDGRAVANPRGTLVLATTRGDAGRILARGDAAGIVRFPAAPLGSLQVVVEADGFAPTTQLVAWNDHAGVAWRTQIALEPGLDLTGRVVDEAGRPVRGARVSARPAPRQTTQIAYRPRPPDPARPPIETDAEGRFRYAVPIGQHLVLVAESPGHVAAETPPLVATTPSDVTLTLRGGVAIHGHVVDRDGAPVADAIVNDTAGHRATSDGDGQFRLAGVDPRQPRVMLSAETDGARASPLAIAPPFDQDVALVLEHAHAITGRVLDASQAPVADALIAFTRRLEEDRPAPGAGPPIALAGEVRADADGRFVVRGLPAGAYALLARAPAADATRASAPIMASATVDADGAPATIVLPAAARIRGRALIAGQPAAAFDVSLVMFGGPVHVATADGRFELAGVAPGPGRYTVRITAEAVLARELEVTVTPGAVLELGDIALDRGRTIRGRVLDAAGGGTIAQASVLVDGLRGERLAVARSDELGNFRIGVPLEPVILHAVMSGVGGSAVVTVPVATESVVLRLPATGQIIVSVTGAPRLEALQVSLARQDAADGGVRLALLAFDAPSRTFRGEVGPGEYVVRARSRLVDAQDADAHDIAVTITEGQTQSVRIALEPAIR